MRLLTIICLVMILAVTASAATRYVKTDGNDANSGSSWNSAWRTIDKLDASLNSGDTAFFAPGVYRGQLNPVTGNSASDPTVYISGNGFDNTVPTSYTNDRAGIWGSEDLSGQTWTVHSGNIWRTNYTPVKNVTLQEATCWVFSQFNSVWDTVLTPRTSIPVGEGQMYYDYGNDIMYVWMFGNDNPNNYDTLDAAWGSAVLFEGQDHVEIYGFDIRYSFQGGVYFSGDHADSNLVSNCNIKGAGQANAANPASVFSASSGLDVDTNYVEKVTGWGNTVRACSLSVSVTPSMWTHRYGIGFYAQQAAIVESCYVAPGFFYGIKYKGNDSFGAIRYNYIEMDDVEDCAGIQFTTQNHFDSVYGNIIVAGTDGFGISIQNKYDTTSNIVIMNNTLYNINERAFQVDWGGDIPTAETKGNNIFKYNVIHTVTGASTAWRGGIVSSPFIGLQYWDIDSNLIYNPGEYRWMVDGNYIDQSTWQNSYGFDENSLFDVDPNFAAPNEGDFFRPNAANEMNLNYGGQTWTVYGAVQSGQAFNCSDPDSTVLLGPVDAASYDVLVSQTNIVTLTWAADSSAQSVQYRVEIADDPSFNNITFETQVSNNLLTVGGYGSSHLEDGAGTVHYWRVTVVAGNCESNPSDYRTFVIRDLAPPGWPAN